MNILIDLDSNNDSVNSVRSDLRFIPNPSIKLEADKKYTIKSNYAKLAFTCYNITSANNTFRCSMDDVPTWEVLTLDQGVYSLDLLQAGIRYHLRITLLTQPVIHRLIYIFFLCISMTRSYFIIDSAIKHLDLTNNGTSTFYEFLGFTSADSDLTGALQYVSTNQASLLQALNNFKITCNWKVSAIWKKNSPKFFKLTTTSQDLPQLFQTSTNLKNPLPANLVNLEKNLT